MRDLIKNFRQDCLKIPNVLTELRLIFCPLPGILLFSGNHYGAVISFILIAITDKLDGYLARRLNQITKLGQTLDPIVDKWLIFCSLIFLCIESKIVIILVMFYFYYCAALLILFLKTDKELLPTKLGRWNMFAQCIVVGVLMLPIDAKIHYIAIAFSVVMLGFSYKSYFKRYNSPT